MALDTVSTATVELKMNWDVEAARSGFTGVRNTETLTRRITFTKGAGADAINELCSFIQTVNASSTVDVDLSAALTNVVNSAAVTIARIKFIAIELLTATDTDATGAVIGTACSSILVGGDATAPWLFLVDGTDKVRLLNGDFIAVSRRGATGLVVTGASADVLQIQNEDAVVAAKVRVTVFGAAT